MHSRQLYLNLNWHSAFELSSFVRKKAEMLEAKLLCGYVQYGDTHIGKLYSAKKDWKAMILPLVIFSHCAYMHEYQVFYLKAKEACSSFLFYP